MTAYCLDCQRYVPDMLAHSEREHLGQRLCAHCGNHHDARDGAERENGRWDCGTCLRFMPGLGRKEMSE